MNCIMIPTHPKDYHYVYDLLDTATEEENIVIVFSSLADKNQFRHKFKCRAIIVDLNSSEDRNNYITRKKLKGLEAIYKDYEYIAVIDSECKFLRPTTPHLGEIWKKNCLLANHSDLGGNLMSKVAGLCGITLRDGLYPWFNDIPVYKTSILPGFLPWAWSKREAMMDYNSFDYLLFCLYCRFVLGLEWRVFGSGDKSIYGLTEGERWAQNGQLLMDTHWSIPVFNWYPENIKMLFHLDRYK